MQGQDGADAAHEGPHQRMGAAEIERLKTRPNDVFLQRAQWCDLNHPRLSQLFVDISLPRSATADLRGFKAARTAATEMSIAVNYHAGQENTARAGLSCAGRSVRVSVFEEMHAAEPFWR